jgi:hypothetical protein
MSGSNLILVDSGMTGLAGGVPGKCFPFLITYQGRSASVTPDTAQRAAEASGDKENQDHGMPGFYGPERLPHGMLFFLNVQKEKDWAGGDAISIAKG